MKYEDYLKKVLHAPRASMDRKYEENLNKVLYAPPAVLDLTTMISIPATGIVRGLDYHQKYTDSEKKRKAIGLKSLYLDYDDFTSAPKGESVVRRYKLCNTTNSFAIMCALGGLSKVSLSFATIFYLMRIQQEGTGSYLTHSDKLNNIFFLKRYENLTEIEAISVYQDPHYDEQQDKEFRWIISNDRVHESIDGLGFLHNEGSYVFSNDVDLETESNRAAYESSIGKIRKERESRPTKFDLINTEFGNGIVYFKKNYDDKVFDVLAAIAEYKRMHPELIITAITSENDNYTVNFEKKD
jgi:hypothetical protein